MAPVDGTEFDDPIPLRHLLGDVNIDGVAEIRIEQQQPVAESEWITLTLIKCNGDVFEIHVHGRGELQIYAGGVEGRFLPLRRYMPVMRVR